MKTIWVPFPTSDKKLIENSYKINELWEVSLKIRRSLEMSVKKRTLSKIPPK